MIGVEPCQTPGSAVSVSPSRAVPPTDAGAEANGGPSSKASAMTPGRYVSVAVARWTVAFDTLLPRNPSIVNSSLS